MNKSESQHLLGVGWYYALIGLVQTTSFRRGYDFKFETKELVRGSLNQRYEAYKLARETGWKTINEIREDEDKDPIEGMDIIPMNLADVVYDVRKKYITHLIQVLQKILKEVITMKLEIRNDKVIIDGYVNAVDRFSKPIKERRSIFIEKIMPGAFKKSLTQNPNVDVLLDHDKSNVLAKTSDGTAKIYEDNIGLRANVEISDKNVLEKARKGFTQWLEFWVLYA